jgi:plastocyanin
MTCPAVVNGSPACSGGACSKQCDPGFSLCGGECVNVNNDPDNCGGCGDDCAYNQVCWAGRCLFGCPSGSVNCSRSCVYLNTDPERCGSCNNACPARANAARTCDEGDCGFTCNFGYEDCDEQVMTGCEASLLFQPSTCGGCDRTCSASNAVPSCFYGACEITCREGYADCDADTSNGCECEILNGCAPGEIVDRTLTAEVTIEFGNTLGHKYAPRCLRISAGTRITFSGNLLQHPLVGGTVREGVRSPDRMSPIPNTMNGSSVAFELAEVGEYPFYCDTHTDLGMYGAIFVVP